jgi:hypothetical protein
VIMAGNLGAQARRLLQRIRRRGGGIVWHGSGKKSQRAR